MDFLGRSSNSGSIHPHNASDNGLPVNYRKMMRFQGRDAFAIRQS